MRNLGVIVLTNLALVIFAAVIVTPLVDQRAEDRMVMTLFVTGLVTMLGAAITWFSSAKLGPILCEVVLGPFVVSLVACLAFLGEAARIASLDPIGHTATFWWLVSLFGAAGCAGRATTITKGEIPFWPTTLLFCCQTTIVFLFLSWLTR